MRGQDMAKCAVIIAAARFTPSSAVRPNRSLFLGILTSQGHWSLPPDHPTLAANLCSFWQLCHCFYGTPRLCYDFLHGADHSNAAVVVILEPQL